jgi:hypothetical protein
MHAGAALAPQAGSQACVSPAGTGQATEWPLSVIPAKGRDDAQPGNHVETWRRSSAKASRVRAPYPARNPASASRPASLNAS